MPKSPSPIWRPLTIGDVAFLMKTDPTYLKKRLKRGTFCPPRWISTSDQRIWAHDDLVRWARRNDVDLRPIAALDRRAEAVRRHYGWEVIAR